MNIAILVNEPMNLEPGHTTGIIAQAAVERGHTVSCFGLRDFVYMPDGDCRARAYSLSADMFSRKGRYLLKRKDAKVDISLSRCDVLLLRFNPAGVKSTMPLRAGDLAETVFTFSRFLESQGVLVLNAPEGLAKAANKLYLNYFDEQYRPRTVISQSPQVLIDFVTSCGDRPCVLKPLKGSQGQDVFIVRPGVCENLNQIVDVLTRRGYTIAQEFLPEAASGDVRLIVVDGELLCLDGHYAAVHRVPGDSDFRSNIHAGGEAKATGVSPEMLALVEAVGPQLAADGIFIAGLDFIGGKLVEINVFSIGGLQDAELFYQVPFRDEVLLRLEERFAVHKERLSGMA